MPKEIRLNREQVIKYVNECWDVSDKHWEQYEKPDWDLSWQLYEGKQDLSHKKKWQSRAFWPKTESAIDTTKALIKRGLGTTKKSDWFTTDGFGEQDKQDNKPSRIKKVAKRFIDFTGLVQTFLSSIRTSLIVSLGIIKVYSTEDIPISVYNTETGSHDVLSGWEPSNDEVDPYDVRMSHDMKIKNYQFHGTYMIERINRDYADLVNNQDTNGYNKWEIEKKVRPGDFPNSSEKQKTARDFRKVERNTNIINPIELKEYHGYIKIDPDKMKQWQSGYYPPTKGTKKGRPKNIDRVYTFESDKMYVITMANDKALLKVSGQGEGEESYPNPDNTYVYHPIRPIDRRSNEVYGKALAKSFHNLQLMLNDIWQLNMDNATITILKLFGIDMTQIVDQDDLEWEPGNFIRTWIPMAIEGAFDRLSAVTPSTEAGLPSPGTETATEAMTQAAQQSLKFEDLATSIEAYGDWILKAILDLILTMPRQYHWMIAEVLEEDTATIQDLFSVDTRFDIAITGISGLINKIQTQNKLLSLISILGPFAQTMGVNLRPLIKGIIRSNEDIIDEPVEEILPDVPMLDLNIIAQILSSIDPQLPNAFMQVLQQMQAQVGTQGRAKGGSPLPNTLGSTAQPARGGVNQTALNPMAWLTGGGAQG
jgi:hypothetical protein